jgi:hypothetical protein
LLDLFYALDFTRALQESSVLNAGARNSLTEALLITVSSNHAELKIFLHIALS